MKKYVVTNKKSGEVLGWFTTKSKASERLVQHIVLNNRKFFSNEEGFLTVFDFDVQEKEMQEISDYQEAKKFLGLSDEPLVTICGVSKKHEKALLALSQLFTIADAWNKEDGFVPDFSNKEQKKWFPTFIYDDESAGFVYVDASWTSSTDPSLGSRVCFSTEVRAMAFGLEFQDLYNDFLMIR